MMAVANHNTVLLFVYVLHGVFMIPVAMVTAAGSRGGRLPISHAIGRGM